jgi:hypothetical protein
VPDEPDEPEPPDVLEPDEPLPLLPLSVDVLSFFELVSAFALASAGFESPSLDDFFGALL